tara:strand:- start:23389 stop:24522 length:1134 start_codon:yes stop_codon:yes gene_type:complete
MKTLSSLLLVLTMSLTIGLAELTAQPANDHISDAIDLGEGPFPFSELGVNFQDATFSGDSTPNPCGIGVAGIWYKFRATATGVVAALMVNPNSSIVIFFEGPENATNGQELTWIDQPGNPCDTGPSATIETSPGTTYYVYMRNLSASDVLINVEPAFQAPENDLISNAINLNLENLPFTDENIHFLLATDTDDEGQLNCDSSDLQGVWYKITPQQEGLIQAAISSEFQDSFLIIYESLNPDATSGVQLTWVNQPNNPCSLGNFAEVNAILGSTYYIFAASADAYADVTIDSDILLSTEDNNFIDFLYYPNPVIDQLNFNSKSSIATIKIYNLMGQQVLNHNINSNSGSVDLRNLSKGMYLAEVTSGDKKTTAKILKK